MLRITHTFLDGTLIDGTSRGDGSAEILKAHGWRWSRNLGSWFVPRSREHAANMPAIEAARAALVAAGFDVEVEVDQTRPPVAEVEQARVERQAARVEGLEARAQRAAAQAEGAWVNADTKVQQLPPGGEPIKVGHHSEGRHRAALKRADAAMGRAVEAEREATEAAQRAAAASHTTGARYSVVTVANRIAKLEAELRSVDRKPTEPRWYEANPETGEAEQFRAPHPDQAERIRARYASHRAEIVDQLEYWRGVRAEQIAAGKTTNFGPDTVHKGDLVRIRSHWRRVVRVSAKSVSVETGYSWTDRVAYAEISELRSPEAAAAE